MPAGTLAALSGAVVPGALATPATAVAGGCALLARAGGAGAGGSGESADPGGIWLTAYRNITSSSVRRTTKVETPSLTIAEWLMAAS
jgi:hypothetical protein